MLVNNAGYGQFGLFEAVPRDKVRQQFDLNVFGVMDVTLAVLPHFRARQAGTVVNVSSGAGLFTLPMISLYCASKFALEGFTESLAELASQHIGAKLVVPHGGVTANNFAARQSADGAHASELSDKLSDYDEFVAHTLATFGRMQSASSIIASDVAAVIFRAATDGTDKLRYLVGDDTRGFVKARRELPDDDYVAFMRAQFAAV